MSNSAHELALVEQRRGRVAEASALLKRTIRARRVSYPADDGDLTVAVNALTSL